MSTSIRRQIAPIVLTGFFALFGSASQADTQTPRQVYESYLQAEKNGQSLAEFMYNSPTPSNAPEKEMTPAQKAALATLIGGMKAMVPQNQTFYFESSAADRAQVIFAVGAGKDGYTTVEMGKRDGAWKIKSSCFHVNEKPPVHPITMQQLTNSYTAATQAFSQTPVHGQIHGVPFTPKVCKIWDANQVQFSTPDEFKADQEITIWFHFFRPKTFANTMISQTESPDIDKTQNGKASVWIESKGQKRVSYESGEFGLHLAFSPRNGQGLMPAFIVLKTPDSGTWLEGYFYGK